MQIQVPDNLLSLDNILPDEPLLMMGAGPVPIPAKVAAANGIVINHLGDTMAQIIEQVKLMSRYVFQTREGHILGVAGPGSAAMEMAVTNLVVPGSKVLSVCNGFFSSRLAEMAQRVEAEVVRLDIEEGLSADPKLVEQYIVEHKPQVLTIVQGETSSTVCNTQLADIAAIAKQHDCLVIVDAVCTLSTMPFNMDEWGIDAVITGGQKGLSCIPGVSLIGFSSKAWQFIQARNDQLRHWCLDAKLADQFWYKKSYHYTAPVSGILAIHEALRLVCTETLDVRFARHLRSSQALQAGIQGMGLDLYVKPASRLNSVVGISVPNGIDGKQLLSTMSKRYKVEISGSFGANIVRIGQMGEQCRTHNLFRTLHAFGASLNLLGQKLDLPAGMAALESTLDLNGYADEI
ncbi:aminotransferase class V-fold PLP-dependent enzyme [Paraglaciecola aquimarina]|uniref:Aminotransferase class V-fold PLP-dependent enzyme n=1 Tax=Paraglaciecola algarum TaxID=3050085 RepID=A0ABS9D465_9ALTE|nr:aminotransferase class V-fold PLP-dependent enzyme [Paraglaciecola sp. G1-23]